MDPSRFLFVAGLMVSLLMGSAGAAPVSFVVSDADGKPVKDAVITVAAGKDAPPAQFSWPLEMKQQNLAFDPYVLIVPAGAEVTFPNLDRVRHHVYSFSKGNKFELKLYGREDARTVKLETPGVAAIGCNIHDMMVAYIRVVDTPYAGKTDAAGKLTLNVPDSAAEATVWHPDAKPAEARVKLPTKPTGQVAVTLKIKRHDH